jgi:hypothetical protein
LPVVLDGAVIKIPPENQTRQEEAEIEIEKKVIMAPTNHFMMILLF